MFLKLNSKRERKMIMSFEDIFSVFINILYIIIILILYILQTNKFTKTGNSVINRLVEDKYKKWYFENSFLITSKDLSIHGFNKILNEFKDNLILAGFKKKHIIDYIAYLENNKTKTFSLKRLLLEIFGFFNINLLITIFLAKKEEGSYLELLIKEISGILSFISSHITIIIVVVSPFLFIYLLYAVRRINLNKLRQTLLVDLLNIWDKDKDETTNFSEITLDSDKIYLNYYIEETRLDKFFDDYFGKSRFDIVDVVGKKFQEKDHIVFKIISFIFKTIFESIFPLWHAACTVICMHFFQNTENMVDKIIIIVSGITCFLGFLLSLNSQFIRDKNEARKRVFYKYKSIKFVKYNFENGSRLFMYILISVGIIFNYRQQLESLSLIIIILSIISILITFIMIDDDEK